MLNDQSTTNGNGNDNGHDPHNGDGNGDGHFVPDEASGTQVQPIDGEQPPRLPFPVVAVGASAGGLESYTEFLQNLPANTGIAFVFIQHLSPRHESIMADILGKHTPMPVLQVEDGMAIEPDHVYVIRPGHTMTMQNGRLRLGPSLLSPGHRRPVDDFFRSLAVEQRERAIAVILSGMGSNGTAGAQDIKAVGGLCVAQDPESAKYPSMPRSLIDSGLADLILPVGEIPGAVIRYTAHPYVSGNAAAPLVKRDPKALAEILGLLRARVRHDFSGYKKPTIIRRVERRMSLHQIDTMTAYARHLRHTPTEITTLADDLMIHVTGFFRDPEAWIALRDRTIRPLIASRNNGDPIRIWVTACSTGEEAYTMAMLLVESAEAAGKSFDIKIFATDTAERSLAQARNGIFPGGIESEVSPERLSRFFTKDDAFYHIRKELRELVVFAPQNLLQDPPFSRLDICTCRNLLIYLEPEVQQRVIALLHFGLRDGGTLFLGNSETIGSTSEPLFEPLDKKWRIYRRVGSGRHPSVEFPLPSQLRGHPSDLPALARPIARVSSAQLAAKNLLDDYTPAAVVVDRDGQIVYFHGPTNLFLELPKGEPTRDLLTLARPGLRNALRHLLHDAFSTNTRAVNADAFLDTPAGRARVEITAAPLDKAANTIHLLVTFRQFPDAPTTEAIPGQTEDQLREDLHRVRDELRTTIEELQSSNEEMKASIEETTSINEELQSANEELETSKEELQSLNEELSTVNVQLHTKMEELERTGNDLASLLSSTDIAVIFLDASFRIRRFTPATDDLFDLIPADVGRSLADLARKFEDPDLFSDARAVLDRLVPIEKEIVSRSGNWYVRRILPYRTSDNRIDGVVLTFVDITEIRRAVAAQHELEERLRWSVEASGLGDWELDLSDRSFRGSDRSFRGSDRSCSLLGLPCQAPSTYAAFLAAIHPGDRARFEEALNRASDPAGDGQFALEFRVSRPDQGISWVEARGAVTFNETPAGRIPAHFRGMLGDFTERKLVEAALSEAKRHAEAANDAKDQFLATVSHELRTPLSAILLWSQMIAAEANPSPAQIRDAMTAIRSSAESQRKLIEDLLDTVRISTGKFRLDLRDVDLLALVRSTVDVARPLASAKNIRIAADLSSDVGTVRIDAERITQVVLNLLNNSIKFTPFGGHILVGLWRRGDDVEIRVADNGQGIPPETLPLIFNRFHQAESGGSASMRTKGGLGLGLTICRQIVELHKGTISAHSEGDNTGATFTVFLPIPPLSPAQSARKPHDTLFANSLAGRSILLVEDDAATRQAMIALLTLAGASITPADSTASALEAFLQKPHDIIVSDIGLPEDDGYALMRRIRTLEAERGLPPTPAIALTAFTQERDRQTAATSGFTQFVPKPVDAQRLMTALTAILPPID